MLIIFADLPLELSLLIDQWKKVPRRPHHLDWLTGYNDGWPCDDCLVVWEDEDMVCHHYCTLHILAIRARFRSIPLSEFTITIAE